MNNNYPYHYFPNFILRTPILSFDFYKKITAGTTISNNVFKQLYSDPLIKEACFLASPTLYFEMEKWIKGEVDFKKEKKIQLSFLKYLSRMTTRCTPFGLFAGCSLGEISDRTVIENTFPHLNLRHTRLDMNYLVAFSQDLSKKKGICENLLHYPNSSIYRIGNQLRYIEYSYKESRRQHQIVEVEDSEYLQKILSTAVSGVYLQDLINLLVEEGVPRNVARDFIYELLESQILVSEIEPSVTGMEFMSQIKTVLKKVKGSKKEIDFLNGIENKLDLLDNQIGNSPENYLVLSKYLEEYPTSHELRFLFQTDLKLKPKNNNLSFDVLESVKKGIVFLNRLTPPSAENNLSRFKEAFREHYEEREMPLSKVMDVETGIGYLQDKDNGDVNPLVDDIRLPLKEEPYNSFTFTQNNIHRILENKLIQCDKAGLQKIVLTDKDFENFPIYWDDLPDSFSSMIQVVLEDDNEKIKFTGVGGSSAANLIGRFCHGDDAIRSFTQNIVDIEKELEPDKIRAEIVHLPEARVGNILMRPSLREYEIPYLAKSSLDFEHQIPLDDLFVSVRNDRIVLRSGKFDKEIIPHLTNAHNFSINALPIYQFLCDLQNQDIRKGLYFSFGFLENNRTFLPRVEYDNLILQEAKWKIKKEDIESLQNKIENTEALKIEVQVFRSKLKLPRYALLSDGDNELLVNFENITSVQMFLDSVKNRTEFLLTEFLFENDGIVKSECGYYTHQFVVSFFNKKKFQLQKELANG